MLNRIRSIYLFVTDIRASVEWYAGAFTVPILSFENNFASIRLGEILLCFHQADQKSPVSTGGCVVYWQVPDIEVALTRMVNAGAQLYRGPVPSEDGEQICQIKDPFGNVFGLEGPLTSESKT